MTKNEISRLRMNKAYKEDPEKFRQRGKQWRQDHLEDIRAYDRSRRLKKRYGITIEERDQMISDQGGRCALCERLFEGTNRPNVDHDHETNRIRGILCFSCNQALGKLGDTYEKMKKVMKYLKEPK